VVGQAWEAARGIRTLDKGDQKMKRNSYLVMALIIVGCVGCSRIFKEAYYGATGATGRVSELQQVRVDLAKYNGFEVKPFSDRMEGTGNTAFLAVVEAKVSEEIVKKTYLGTGGRNVLQISGELISYDTGSTTEKVTGPMEQAVCRIKLVDKSSGEVLGTGDCLSRAKSSARKGPEELGEGTGKGIAEWIVKYDTRGERPKEKD